MLKIRWKRPLIAVLFISSVLSDSMAFHAQQIERTSLEPIIARQLSKEQELSHSNATLSLEESLAEAMAHVATPVLETCSKLKYGQLVRDTYSDAPPPVDIITAEARYISDGIPEVTMNLRNITDHYPVNTDDISYFEPIYAWAIWLDSDNNPETGAFAPDLGADDGLWFVYFKENPEYPFYESPKVYDSTWSKQNKRWVLFSSLTGGGVIAGDTLEFRGATVSQRDRFFLAAIDYTTNTFDIVCNEWVDLSAIEQDFRAKLTADSTNTTPPLRNQAAYAYYLYCMADMSGKEWARTGSDGWAGGFIKYMFDEIYRDSLPTSTQIGCTKTVYNFACFDKARINHFTNELVPAFRSYCDASKGNLDYTRWDTDHNTFLEQALDVCLQDLIDMDELNPTYVSAAKVLVPVQMKRLREETQNECRATYGANLNNPNIRQIADIEEQSPPLTEEELYNPALRELSTLKVLVDHDFFVPVGTILDVQVENSLEDDQLYYELSVSEEIATISQEGVLTIKSQASASPTFPTPILIMVRNDAGEQGIGQVAVRDSDSDGDDIVDSYEVRVGLDPFVFNSPNSDLDQDGLSDLAETRLLTEPMKPDTDEDGYNDGCEVRNKSNPLDRTIIPREGCNSDQESVRLYLPLITR